MQILPITTPRLKKGDDLARILAEHASLQNGDILIVSSKAVAMTEGASIQLSSVIPSAEAKTLAKECNQDPRFTELVLQETKRMNGTVVGTCPFAILTSLKPDGMKQGRILVPNAGLDQSNVEDGYAIGWPLDPVQSVKTLQKQLSTFQFPLSIILSDSCCRPSRLGVTAFALTVAGMDPMKSEVGTKDLFGKTLRVTQEARADQLATAANAVMGNAAQSIPAAIIRDAGIPSSDFCGWVDGIEPKEDLFRGMI